MSDTPLSDEAVQYLKDKKIPDLMEHFLHELMVHMPEDPIKYLINIIDKPNAPKIVIAGPPAAGKGTQCEKIVESFGVVHISTGDMLRAEVKANTKLGQEADAYMKRGDLVPDSLLIDLVKKRLQQEDAELKGWMLDGFPRTKTQALEMRSAGILPQRFVLLECPDEVVTERIEGRRTDPVTGKVYHMVYNPPTDKSVIARLEQRQDDTRVAIAKRLGEYHRNIKEIIDSYGPIVSRIDGNRQAPLVFADISRAIASG